MDGGKEGGTDEPREGGRRRRRHVFTEAVLFFLFFMYYSKEVLNWGVEVADKDDKTQSKLRPSLYRCSEGSRPHID